MDRKSALILSFGILVRFVFWCVTPATSDGAITFYFSRQMLETLTLPPTGVPGVWPLWYPPLFHVLTGGIYALTGVLTLSPLVFGSMGLLAFYFFVQRFFKEHATLSLFILAMLPFHVYYSSIGYFESLMFLLAVAAFYNLLAYLETNKTNNLFYCIFYSVLSGWTHYHGFALVGGIFLALLLTRRKEAIIYLILTLLLVSPWYVRNTVEFGSPIWPKLSPGYYPYDIQTQGEPLSASMLSLLSANKWLSGLLEFWVGAPNSGYDFFDKMEIGKQTIPYFPVIFALWCSSVVFMSIAAGAGFVFSRKNVVWFLFLFIFAISSVFFASNGLPRMFYAMFPILVLYIAAGFQLLFTLGTALRAFPQHRKEYPLVVLLSLVLLGTSLGYAYTYHNIRAPYMPFFQEIKDKLPSGARVLMPDKDQECLLFTGKQCMHIGSMGGAIPTEENWKSAVSSYDADYVCCSNINQDTQNNPVCLHYTSLVIDYSNGSAWGKCWKVKSGGGESTPNILA